MESHVISSTFVLKTACRTFAYDDSDIPFPVHTYSWEEIPSHMQRLEMITFIIYNREESEGLTDTVACKLTQLTTLRVRLVTGQPCDSVAQWSEWSHGMREV